MSNIIDALMGAVATREIDLGECADMYAGIKLPVRANWPRAWKKRRWALSKEYRAIQDEYNERDSDTDTEALNERSAKNAASWADFWAGVLMMNVVEVGELKAAMPDPHWEWLIGRVIFTMTEYEAEETKKALGSRGRISVEPEPSPQTSGTG